MLKRVFFSLTAAVTVIIAAPAFAGDRCSSGEIANFLGQAGVISCDTAQEMDDAHASMGSPLDRAPGVILDRAYPGAGAVYDTVRVYPGQGAPSFPQPQGNPTPPFPGPSFPQPTVPDFYPQSVGFPRQQASMTNFCATPFGRIGPFPEYAPVGAPCWVMGPDGRPVPGVAQ